MKKICLGLFLSLLFVSSAWSDTLYLKNGTKLKGEIVEDTGYSIKFKINGVVNVYYANEYDKATKGEEKPAVPAVAPVAKMPTPAQISENKEDLIRRLLDANGVRDSITRIFSQAIEQAPEASRARLKEIMDTKGMIDRLVPLYAKYYTEEELKELINFYKSPVGQKHLNMTPKLMEETMNITIKYFKEKAAEADAKSAGPVSPASKAAQK
jgi:hypothetical protein